MFLFFFFSSRRRHTRWNCDWSSDVCSSDLAAADELAVAVDLGRRERLIEAQVDPDAVGREHGREQHLGVETRVRDSARREEVGGAAEVLQRRPRRGGRGRRSGGDGGRRGGGGGWRRSGGGGRRGRARGADGR